MYRYLAGGVIGILLSLCILGYAGFFPIKWDDNFGLSDIAAILSALLIGFYLPHVISNALSQKKDKKQNMLSDTEEISKYCYDYVNTVKIFCCEIPKNPEEKEMRVNMCLHHMERLTFKIKKLGELNEVTKLISKDIYKTLYNDFLEYRNILDNLRNTTFQFDYTFLQLFSLQMEAKVIENLHKVKLKLFD